MFALILLFSLPAIVSAEAGEDVLYRMGSGDSLRVTVFGQKDLSGTFNVDGTGSISMPLIGNVPVGGLTVREAGAAVPPTSTFMLTMNWPGTC